MVAHHRIPDYLAAMDVALVMGDGRSGAFHYSPVKLREYLACGLAVIAPRVGELARVLDHGETAWLVPPADAQATADAISLLARRADLRARLGEAARRSAEANDSWESRVRALLDHLGSRDRR